MRLTRIFDPSPLSPNTTVTLSQKASLHLVKVLRLKSGEAFILFNGEGSAYEACLLEANARGAVVSVRAIAQISDGQSPLSLHLGQAVLSPDKMVLCLQKATELGATEITPIYTQDVRSKRERGKLEDRYERWSQVLISACEQCFRLRLPVLRPPMDLAEWLTSPFEGTKIAFEPTAQRALKTVLTASQIRILLGPESGFDKSELTQIESANYTLCTLGPRVLRAETATLAGITLVQHLWGDLN